MLRILALGMCADAMDELWRASESMVMECMKRFCKAIRREFGDYNLWQSTWVDCKKQVEINTAYNLKNVCFIRLHAL